MPLYDYDCVNCGKRFEILRGVHADSPSSCVLCGGGPIKKAFATPAIHFKGSGWAKKERRAGSGHSSTKASRDGATAAKEGGSTESAGDHGARDGGAAAPSSGDGSASSDTAKVPTSSKGSYSSSGSSSKGSDSSSGSSSKAD